VHPCSDAAYQARPPCAHEIKREPARPDVELCLAQKRDGFTQMHVDQKDARGFRLNRYWHSFEPVTVEARHRCASFLIGVGLRFTFFLRA